jgi:protein CWC15
MLGNPLLNASTFTVKRRWDEDVVFKNQTRGEKKVRFYPLLALSAVYFLLFAARCQLKSHPTNPTITLQVAKRFINDTIRSDFHRNFMKKYIL